GDALLHRLGLTHQRDVAGGGLVPTGGDADEGLVDLLPREPHRIVVGALRSALGTLGHVPAGQLRFEVGLRVHCAFRAPLPPKSAPANGRSPDVLGPRSQRRVWPNRGAAEPDSHSYVNVLAVLHARNRINEWLTKNVTPWHQPPADGAGRTREEYSHFPMLGRRAASGRDASM